MRCGNLMKRFVSLNCIRPLMTQTVRFQFTLSSKASAFNVQPVHCGDTVEQFLDSHDTFIIDCDGVLWDNDHVTRIPGIPEATEKLHQLGKRVLYATNNSIVSRLNLKRKFQQHGFDATIENIFSNGYSSAVFIKNILNITGKVYLVGGEGMKWELDQEGVEHFGVGPDPDRPTADIQEMLSMKFEDNVGAVLVGFDPHFSYNKLYKAASYLTNPGCHFIAASDIERSIFIGENRNMPMPGALVSAIGETAKRQSVVVGKPNKLMFDCIMKVHPEVDKSRTVMIGDNLKADIGFAKAAGIASALVLSGSNRLEQVKELPHLAPDFVMSSLVDIVCK